MGRTLPTFTMHLNQEMELWRPFRRALAAGDRAAFDRMFALARRHIAEAANAARPVPFDALVMTILLEQQKEIDRLSEELRIADRGLRNEEKHQNPDGDRDAQDIIP
ncbi:MAG: hypothetical protein ABFD69_16085 [Candidatus Sumerlaeia bacterium]